MTRAQLNLERPVKRETAARKLAKLRGHRGDTGGWIRNAAGYPLCQGWRTYAERARAAGVLGQDLETGLWHVSVAYLTTAELAAAEEQASR